MIELTKNLKKMFFEFEPLEVLKGAYSGEEIHIFTCGNSLKYFVLPDLKNKFVLSVKQTYSLLKDFADIHVYNPCNYSSFNYHDDCIKMFSAFRRYQYNQYYNYDIFFPSAYKDIKNCTATTKDFDYMQSQLVKDLVWGPGIMYDLVIPLCVHIGVKKIFVYGWDIHYGNDPYFFDSNHSKRPSIEEMELIAQSTDFLYDWLSVKGIELFIMTPNSSVSQRFKRL